jgi:hypothetical protein
MDKNQAIYGQFGLEVTSKNCKESQIAFNFYEFWSEELHYNK